MQTLKEFLATADADHAVALQQARDYVANHGRLLAATTVNSILAELDITADVKAIADSETHPARHKMASVILGIQGGEPFNFIQGDSQGDRVLAMLAWLGDNAPEIADKWPLFQASVIGMANEQVQPFANATLHDVLIIRDDCPSKPVETVGGWATITTNIDTERHNPRLLAQSPRTGKWQRVNSFMGVEAGGVYECRVPREFVGWALAVDNAYGAVV